jgi:hypothetical protein
MIIRIIQSLIRGNETEATSQGAVEESKKQKEARLVDVAQESLRKTAAGQRADLEGMVRHGWPRVKREKFKGSTRKKVWDIVGRSLGSPDSDMIEEITEKIADVAEVDPYYQEIFQDKSE